MIICFKSLLLIFVNVILFCEHWIVKGLLTMVLVGDYVWIKIAFLACFMQHVKVISLIVGKVILIFYAVSCFITVMMTNPELCWKKSCCCLEFLCYYYCCLMDLFVLYFVYHYMTYYDLMMIIIILIFYLIILKNCSFFVDSLYLNVVISYYLHLKTFFKI